MSEEKNVYEGEAREDMIDGDEISPEEEGFMKGYEEGEDEDDNEDDDDTDD